MKRCVIIGAVKIGQRAAAAARFCNEDFFVYCDAGLDNIQTVGHAPNLVVGDFDSHKRPQTGEIITLPVAKDDTDTAFAAKEAVRRGFDKLLLCGVVGGRIDHSVANLSLLLWLYEKGIDAKIVDDYCEISVVAQEPAIVQKNECEFFSLFSLSGSIDGVSIEGAKFPLDKAIVKPDNFFLSTSNEVDLKVAKITIASGSAFLAKIF